MPDNSGATGFSSSGNLVFNNRDNSSNTAELRDHKHSRNTAVIEEEKEKEELAKPEFVDRSAQLSATLNSLAVINAVKIVKKDEKGFNFPSIKKDINIFYGSRD